MGKDQINNMKRKVDEQLLKVQVLETLNVPSLKDYWFHTGTSNFLHATICNKFGYGDGIFKEWVYSDDITLKRIPNDEMNQAAKYDDIQCWRVKLDIQKDMNFIQNVYNIWRRTCVVQWPVKTPDLLSHRPSNLIPSESENERLKALTNKLKSCAWIKMADTRYFDICLKEYSEML